MHQDLTGPETARLIAVGYREFDAHFREITRRAPRRFDERDWRGLQRDATERLDVYAGCVDDVVEKVRTLLGDALEDRSVWAHANETYRGEMAERPDLEIAETFFNSITRRIFHTVGVDDRIEFITASDTPPSVAGPPRRRYVPGGSIEDLFDEMLDDFAPSTGWQNRRRDVFLAAEEVRRHLALLGAGSTLDRAEMLEAPFFRGQGAYLVGTLGSGEHTLPMAFVLHNTTRGLMIGAMLLEADDLSILFSYTRSSFHVEVDRPRDLAAYLQTLMPHKKAAELYTIIGYQKHGKTELFRDFLRHVTTSEDRFEHARGIRGLVMIVFTMPGYDVVFKVIRDRFPYPKQTTRRQIKSKYQLVFRSDRAGRLIEAQEYEHLRFARDRFTPQLISELESDAARSVTVDAATVTLHHVYVERRVTPLDIYVREANPIKARSAIIDYGRAIKNLAAMNIFPGDMLLKNFGVTRSGRVVFYDYDEIMPLTDCNFRELPDTDVPDDEMAADPWFGVGDSDIFPEEFARFMGIRDELREAFEYFHGDLYGVRFWRRTQERIKSGEVIEVFPYMRSRRLGAGFRRRRRTSQVPSRSPLAAAGS